MLSNIQEEFIIENVLHVIILNNSGMLLLENLELDIITIHKSLIINNIIIIGNLIMELNQQQEHYIKILI